MPNATGLFVVTITPQSEDKAEGSTLGRLSIDKQYRGDLEATGTGEMLTAMTEVQGSGVYVAVERVTGTIRGRSGSFVMRHSGTMNRGVQQLSITIVPDSGTGQLAGMTGQMAISVGGDGKHSYDFEYTLP